MFLHCITIHDCASLNKTITSMRPFTLLSKNCKSWDLVSRHASIGSIPKRLLNSCRIIWRIQWQLLSRLSFSRPFCVNVVLRFRERQTTREIHESTTGKFDVFKTTDVYNYFMLIYYLFLQCFVKEKQLFFKWLPWEHIICDMACVTCLIGISLIILTASEASSHTIFDDFIGSQTKMLAGWLAMVDYPSAISANSKMAAVVCSTVISSVLYLLGQTK